MSNESPREFLLNKRSVPTIGSSYDTLEVIPESDCDPRDIQAEKILGQIRCVPKVNFDALKEENAKLKTKLNEIWDCFYGQNMKLAGWHLNGDLEPIDKFFDNNDWSVDGVEREK